MSVSQIVGPGNLQVIPDQPCGIKVGAICLDRLLIFLALFVILFIGILGLVLPVDEINEQKKAIRKDALDAAIAEVTGGASVAVKTGVKKAMEKDEDNKDE